MGKVYSVLCIYGVNFPKELKPGIVIKIIKGRHLTSKIIFDSFLDFNWWIHIWFYRIWGSENWKVEIQLFVNWLNVLSSLILIYEYYIIAYFLVQ
jgi:hypothetical protein